MLKLSTSSGIFPLAARRHPSPRAEQPMSTHWAVLHLARLHHFSPRAFIRTMWTSREGVGEVGRVREVLCIKLKNRGESTAGRGERGVEEVENRQKSRVISRKRNIIAEIEIREKEKVRERLVGWRG